MSSINVSDFDSTTIKLLGKAGLDPRCTPNILRAKVEQKMKLQKDELLPYRLRMKKLIIKWWKETQTGKDASGAKRSSSETGNSSSGGSSSNGRTENKKIKMEASKDGLELLEKYKLFRQYTKAMNRADLLAGLTDIPEISAKLKELRKRLHEAGLKSSTLTEADVREAEKLTKEGK